VDLVVIVLAQMMKTSAIGLLLIHDLVPVSA
jgi:hypothetical protein